jgi:capsular polysaccharide biosynthesis protein
LPQIAADCRAVLRKDEVAIVQQRFQPSAFASTSAIALELAFAFALAFAIAFAIAFALAFAIA